MSEVTRLPVTVLVLGAQAHCSKVAPKWPGREQTLLTLTVPPAPAPVPLDWCQFKGLQSGVCGPAPHMV